MTDKLKSCPFCGDPRAFVAELNEARQVWCMQDNCARGPIRDDRAEAIAAWNTRKRRSR
jgi:Lar family restriction alleviation protein